MGTGEAQIVGIFLVRNEDIFFERAVRNVVGFCDRILIADNFSTDRTWDIAQQLAREISSVECHRIRRTGDSHELIKHYAGRDVWLFGVDGDEIYDPVGLARFREELLGGKYDDWWVIFGNVLNCVSLDTAAKRARGYLAPPCRSMTKLYNFRAISRWDGPCLERMLGGTPVFEPGYDASLRLNLHEQTPWGTTNFRCLHTCFLRRSGRESEHTTDRPNPVEIAARGFLGKIGLGFLKRRDMGAPANWKQEKYKRGELVDLDVATFFPAPSATCAAPCARASS